MILKLLVQFYCWLWDIPIWHPTGEPFDLFAIIIGVTFLDLPALVFSIMGVVALIDRRRSK